MKNTIITLASVAALAGAANAQTVFSMKDTTMNASDFTLSLEDITPGTTNTATISTSATGGNGGSYLILQHDYTNTAASGGAVTYWTRNGWTLDPSSFTAVQMASLKFFGSYDSKNEIGNQGSTLFVKQGGNHYNFASDGSAFQPTWTNVSQSGFQHSALTATGGIIEFGFTGNHGGPTGTYTRSGATDNIQIIATVPEPSSTALLGLGGLALILRRRK